MYFISFKVNGEMIFSGKRRNLIETFRSDMNENCKGYHQDQNDLWASLLRFTSIDL